MPCPICGGWDRLARGQGRRCAGFLSSDGKFAYCTREEKQEGSAGYCDKAKAWFHAVAPLELSAPRPKKKRGTYVCHYEYLDEGGELLFQVVRTREADGEKGFYQRVPDRSQPTGWRKGPDVMRGVRRVPFGLPAILEADPDAYVWIVEGEKDVLAMVGLGLVATCNPMGAEKWSQMDPDAVRVAFDGRAAVILPDHDFVGRKHAREVAEALRPIASEIKILDLFGEGEWAEHSDVSDWLARRSAELEPSAIAAKLGELAYECPAWTAAIAAAEAREQEAAEWGPLELGADGGIAPFPTDVFPLPVRDLCVEASRVMGMPLDFFAAGVLAIAAAAVGRSRSMAFKDSWVEPPNLYMGIIGNPGQGKTPALKLVSRPLWQISDECLGAHKEAKKAAREAAKREARAAAERGMKRPTISDEEDEESPPQRIVVSDITTEALAMRLQDNPRGLVIVRDELSGWMAGLNQYKGGGKGADRQFFLEAWSGSPAPVDRKGQSGGIPVYSAHPCLSLVGGIQPEVVRQQFDQQQADDGLIDRFLFVAPADAQRRVSRDEIPEVLKRHWGDAVRRLWALELPVGENGNTESLRMKWTGEAADAFFPWMNDVLFAEAWGEDFPTRLRGVWTKLASYCGRIALLLELLHYASNLDLAGDPRAVSLRSFKSAVRVIDYFKSHLMRVHGMIRGRKPENPDAEAIVNWIRREQRARWKLRDLKDNLRCRFRDADAELAAALKWLELRNAIRICNEPEQAGKPGRKSVVYDSHPHLLREG